jgi:dynein heavy chain, axonemal
MKDKLLALKPALLDTGKEVEVTLATVNQKNAEAAAVREVVATDEAVASEKTLVAASIKAECEKELAVAIPMLESALRALDTLTKADITEVKAMKNPPAAVKMVMEVVCIMLGVKAKRVNDPNKPGGKVDDFWTPSQVRLLHTVAVSRGTECNRCCEGGKEQRLQLQQRTSVQRPPLSGETYKRSPFF